MIDVTEYTKINTICFLLNLMTIFEIPKFSFCAVGGERYLTWRPLFLPSFRWWPFWCSARLFLTLFDRFITIGEVHHRAPRPNKLLPPASEACQRSRCGLHCLDVVTKHFVELVVFDFHFCPYNFINDTTLGGCQTVLILTPVRCRYFFFFFFLLLCLEQNHRIRCLLCDIGWHHRKKNQSTRVKYDSFCICHRIFTIRL